MMPVVASLGAVLLSACGAGARGDTASFDIGGRVISVTESGTATIQQDGAPPIDYSGPLGCAGRYFTTEDANGLPLDFRYSAHDAYLLFAGTLHHLAVGPIRTAKALHWSASIDGARIGVTVDCPLPAAAVPPLSAAFPSACALLTRTIATRVLGHGVGRAQLTRQGSFDTHCSYQTNELDLISLDVSDAATTRSESSWRSPAISGLGVPAHAPTPDGSLVAVKGNIGIEVVVGLGGSRASDTAAEIRVARVVLANIHG
jgi:hypothetical protein